MRKGSRVIVGRIVPMDGAVLNDPGLLLHVVFPPFFAHPELVSTRTASGLVQQRVNDVAPLERTGVTLPDVGQFVNERRSSWVPAPGIQRIVEALRPEKQDVTAAFGQSEAGRGDCADWK